MHKLLLAAFLFGLVAVGNPLPATAQDAALPDSEQVEFLLFEGGLLFEEGRYLAAATNFARAVDLEPDNIEAHLSLARALTHGLMAGEIAETEAAAAQARDHYLWVLEHTTDVFDERDARRGIRILNAHFLQPEGPPLESRDARRAWEKGELALEEEKYTEAVRHFQQAARLEPDVLAVQKRLGMALRLDGRDGDALRAYERALELDPDDYESHSALGEIFEKRGEADPALIHFRRAFGLEPLYEPAAEGVIRLLDTEDLENLSGGDLTLLGRAHLSLEHYEVASVFLEHAVEVDAGLPARKALGITEFFRHNDEASIALLEAVHRESLDDLEVLYYLGAANLRQDRQEQGVTYLRDLLSRDPDNPNALRLLGLSLADDPDSSEEALNLLLRADRAGAWIENLSCILGTLYMRLGQTHEAEPLMQDCLRQNPDFPGALLGLGIISDERGKTREAIDYLSAYLETEENPELAAIFRLGVAYLRSGQDELGFDALRRLVETNQFIVAEDSVEVTDTQLLEATSYFLASVRRFNDAIFIGEMLLTRDSENAIYNNNLSMTYADAKRNLGRALALARKANALDPDNPGHLDTLGWALLRNGQYEEAELVLLKSIRLAGENEESGNLSEIYYHLGLLYRTIERPDEATQYLTLALENPPTPYLQAEIERLLELEPSEADPDR